MLPFTKRPARPENSSENINTDEIEVIRSPRGDAPGKRPDSRYASPGAHLGQMPAQRRQGEGAQARPSDRPRVFQHSLSDEDRTLLMPAKPKLTAPPPAMPTPGYRPPHVDAEPRVARAPSPNMRGMMRQRADTERTIIRPTPSPIGMTAAESWTPKTEVDVSSRKAPAMLPTPYVAFKPPVPPKLPDVTRKTPVPPLPKPAAVVAPVASFAPVSHVAKPTSDPKIDPPAAVLSMRPPKAPSAKRSNLTWAAALMVGGVFIGLGTAVLARGDGDSILDATASFVDPSKPGHAAVGARPAATTVSTPVVNVAPVHPIAKDTKKDTAASCLAPEVTPQLAVNTPVVKSEVAKPEVKPEPVARPLEFASPRPEPPKPAPIAYAAPPPAATVAAPPPAPKPVFASVQPAQNGGGLHAVPAAQPARPQAPAPQPVALAPRAVAPAPAPAPAKPAAAKPAGRDEFASAAAVDALAKAQLEASLR